MFKMKKSYIISFVILFILSLLFVQCDSSTEPIPELSFSEIEVHYSKTGGWINSSSLNIYGNGKVEAYEVNQRFDTLKSSSKILDNNEQIWVASLFKSFPTYEPNYFPQNYITDQDHHRIIFIYKGEPDTVSIYMPEKSNLPIGLQIILNELGNIYDEMIDSRDFSYNRLPVSKKIVKQF